MGIQNHYSPMDDSPPVSLPFFESMKIFTMKCIFTPLLILIFSFSSKGQVAKGNWLVGGAGSLYSYNQDFSVPTYTVQYKYTDINASAAVGYFFADKIVAGLRPTFSFLKGHWTGSTGGVGGGSTHTVRYAMGPFARYYFLKADNPYNLLTDVSYQFGTNKNLGALHEKGKYNTFSIMGGPEIYFNTTAGIEILLGYTQKIISTENSPGEFNSNMKGFQVSIGFQLHLKK
jgi:hypothetical protein